MTHVLRRCQLPCGPPWMGPPERSYSSATAHGEVAIATPSPFLCGTSTHRRGPYAVAVQCLLYFSRMPSCGGIRKINWPDGWPRRTNNASGTDATSQGSFLHLSCAGRGDLARCRKRTVSSYGWHAIYGYLDVVGGMQYPPCLAVIRLTVVQCIF
jgi:hypothetical protein